MGIIYMATNIQTNTAYIGKTQQTFAKRRYSHLLDAKLGSETYFHRAIRKYGESSFDWIVIEEVADEHLNDAEIFWIAYYKYIGAELYNRTLGGFSGNAGYKLSNDTRTKMSLAKSNGRVVSFIDKAGNIYPNVINIYAFEREHNLPHSSLGRVASGRRKQANGFRLYEGGDYHR